MITDQVRLIFTADTSGINSAFSHTASIVETSMLAVTGKVLKDSVGAASSMNESMSAITRSTKMSESTVEQLKNHLGDMAVKGTDGMEMIKTVSSGLQGAGVHGSKLADLTAQVTQRGADAMSFWDIGSDRMTDLLGQLMSGQTEGLRKIHVFMTQNYLDLVAQHEYHAKNFRHLTLQQQALVRIKAFLEQTKNTAGDYAATSDSVANKWRQIQADLQKIEVDFGTKLLPAASSFLGTVQKLLPEIVAIGTAMATWAIFRKGGRAISGVIHGEAYEAEAFKQARAAGYSPEAAAAMATTQRKTASGKFLKGAGAIGLTAGNMADVASTGSDNSIGSWIQTAISSTMTGAMAGAAFDGIGALPGALGMLAIGLTQKAFQVNMDGKKVSTNQAGISKQQSGNQHYAK